MRVLLIVWALGAVLPIPALGQNSLDEYQAKAAFLYNFAKFVEWPAQAFSTVGSSINVCILGEDSFGSALEAIQSKQVAGRSIFVNRIATVNQASSCHILFISTSEKNRLKRTLLALKNYPILTVGDIDGFASTGGVIGLVMEDNRIKMEINVSIAQQNGLKLSSQLLKLARVIREGH